MKKTEKIVWRWEVDELKEEFKVPTLKEKIERGLSDEEWIMICYQAHKNGKCFREYSGHKICDTCLKRNR
jgi:hypothetical protein